MKPLNEMSEIDIAELAKRPVADRCDRILCEFDEWLAVRVLRLGLRHEDLPQLNDAFRDYFADTRTARTA